MMYPVPSSDHQFVPFITFLVVFIGCLAIVSSCTYRRPLHAAPASPPTRDVEEDDPTASDPEGDARDHEKRVVRIDRRGLSHSVRTIIEI